MAWGRQGSTNCLKWCNIPQNLAKFSNLRYLLIFPDHKTVSNKEIIIKKITTTDYELQTILKLYITFKLIYIYII